MKSNVRKVIAGMLLFALVLGNLFTGTGKQNVVTAYAETSGVTDFVSRLYSEILGREADEGGLATWTNALLSGEFSGTEVAKGFIMSEEFLNKDMTNEEFVQILYRAFFGREADAAGLNTWVDFLDQGYRKSYVFAGFANSDEFGALCDSYAVEAGSVPVTISEQQPNLSDEDYNIWLFVERMYTEVLDRPADMAGIQSWVDVLKDGTWTGAQVASGFIMSNEFLGKEITSEEYVKIMYMAFFGREADENGLNLWVNGLESGEYSKEYIFAGFANSAEFGGLCSNYGITQGEVEIPETETEEIPFVVYKGDDVSIYRAEAGVIITVKDGYCGAVNYEGDILVPHKYVSVWHWPNADGMFALEDETGEVVVFNANGKQMYKLPVQYDSSKTLSSLGINEGVLTYDYDGGGIGDVIICAYDLVEGKTLYYNDGETEDGSVSLLMNSRTTAMTDGKFYYSVDCLLISVDRNGTSEIVYENPYWMASPGGKVWYTSAPNGEYGFVYLYNEYEWSYRLGLISTDGEKVSLLKIADLAEVLDVEWDNCIVNSYYPDGVRQSNAGTQAVVYLEYMGERVTDYILLDFAKAEYDTFDLVNEYSGEVVGSEVRISNVEELIVAQYDSIALSDSAYYLAGEENDWFYLDKNGRVAADYVDCADFYNGYAAVIKEDGMVYLVDEEFNETATGYAANGVYTSGAGFILVTDEGEILLIVDEDAPIRQPEKADFVDYYAEGVEIISVGQEVILTYKDGYYGAVDYDGNQLVAYEYPSVGTNINEDGMFALINDNNEAVIFGPDGTELYRMPFYIEDEYEDIPLVGLTINEGVVTYAYGDWMEGCVGAYNLKTGVKFYEEDTWFNRGRVTAMKDGVFYYSSGYQLYAVDKNGWDWVVYDNSEFGLADPGGEVRYINAPNGDYGFVYVQNDYEGIRLGVLNKNTGDISLMTYYDLEAALGVENTQTCSVTSYWGDGTWYNVLNQQAVMYMKNEDDSITKYTLLDFSKAEFAEFDVYDYSGETVGTEVRISNPEELIVAQYDHIVLSESGYYLAGNNNDWFYIDKNGEVVADYVDCASFYNGYAAVIKEDGMVYLIDECFNETATGYAADSIYSMDAGFLVVKDETQRVLVVK